MIQEFSVKHLANNEYVCAKFNVLSCWWLEVFLQIFNILKQVALFFNQDLLLKNKTNRVGVTYINRVQVFRCNTILPWVIKYQAF